MDKQHLKKLYDNLYINLESLYYESEIDVSLINSTLSQSIIQTNTIDNLSDKSSSSRIVDEQRRNVVNSEHIVTDSSTPAVSSFNPDIKWMDIGKAFQNRISTYSILNLKHFNLEVFLAVCEKLISAKIKNITKSQKSIKINFTLACTFENSKSDISVSEEKKFRVENKQILSLSNFYEEFMNYIKPNLLKAIEEFQGYDSGWSLIKVKSLDININDITPSASMNSTTTSIDIQNNDQRCFFASVTAALYQRLTSNNLHLKTSYSPFQELFNHTGIRYPTLLHYIPKIEKLNNLSINIYGFDNNEHVVPVYLSENYRKSNTPPRVYLLMSQSRVDTINEIQAPVYHYSSINNLSYLISHPIPENCDRILICDRCLNPFSSQQLLDSHLEDCMAINKCRISFPKNNHIQFTNHLNKERVPFVVYADLKCTIKPTGENKSKYLPCSIAYYVHCSYNNSKSNLYFYRGQDCINLFSQELYKLSQTFSDIINNAMPKKTLTDEETLILNTSKTCYICNKSFQRTSSRVPFHCHFTGTFCGPAHAHCNLNYKTETIIPVVFHNLSAYNSQLIIKSLSSSFPGSLNVLPINKEKFISFTKTVKFKKNVSSMDSKENNLFIKLRFIDSFSFIEKSIDELSSYLDDNSKIITRNFFPHEQLFKLIKHKRVFPYEYFNNWDKFKENQLPDENWFYSNSNNSGITNKNYEHAVNLWSFLNFKTLGECYSLYLRADVLLLSDVFENFRLYCIFTYDLDPLHYYTASELAFDAMLKCTSVKLDLLKDPEMLLFIEKGIQGGVTQCSNKYDKANNRSMADSSSEKEESYLMHYKVESLYEAAMCSHLPYSSFEWETSDINVMNIPDDSPIGYILEVDLEYPQTLFQLHEDLPLCSDHFTPLNFKESRATTSLGDKTKCVIHYRTLKQCLNLGLKLLKVHRILKFKQSQWLKPYIHLNINIRKQSTNEFGKEFYTLMNNNVYSKTIENVRKHKEVKIISNWEEPSGARSYIALPNFNSSLIYDENLIVVELDKMNVVFDKPIYLGFCILDTLKNYLYDFHYNCISKNFSPNQAKLMYINSEHLIYHFTVPNIHEYASQIMYKLYH